MASRYSLLCPYMYCPWTSFHAAPLFLHAHDITAQQLRDLFTRSKFFIVVLHPCYAFQWFSWSFAAHLLSAQWHRHAFALNSVYFSITWLSIQQLNSVPFPSNCKLVWWQRLPVNQPQSQLQYRSLFQNIFSPTYFSPTI
jgi:hypothetical protein